MSDSKSKGPWFNSKSFQKFSEVQIQRSISKGPYPKVSMVHFYFFRERFFWFYFNYGRSSQFIQFLGRFLYSVQVRNPACRFPLRMKAPLGLKCFSGLFSVPSGLVNKIDAFWGHFRDFVTTQYFDELVPRILTLPIGQVKRSPLQLEAACLISIQFANRTCC